MARRLALMLIGLAVLSACGEKPVGIAEPGSGGTPSPHSGDASDEGELLEAHATVLEDKSHGPMLCLGGVLESLPPQCGDIEIVGWRWDEVEGEEQHSGTTWGDFHVIGRLDGKRFVVTDVGTYQPELPTDLASLAEDIFASPCPEPDGGWDSPDPSKDGESDRLAATKAAQREPDFAGIWIDQLEPFDPDSAEDVGRYVLNVAFTGDLERHEEEIRQVWGGPLCVSQHEYTMAELHKIQNSFSEELDVQTLSSSINVMENVVEFQVVVAHEETRSAITDRYGDAVRITSALTPVD